MGFRTVSYTHLDVYKRQLPTSAAQSNKDFDALAFGANKPTFDGVISAEEWGNYTVEVKGSEAAGKDATAVSAANTTVWNEDVYKRQSVSVEVSALFTSLTLKV